MTGCLPTLTININEECFKKSKNILKNMQKIVKSKIF